MTEQRSTHRFDLHLPVEITRTPDGRISENGWIRNIGSGGVLFTAKTEFGPGATIEYLVKLTESQGNSVHLRCIGKVLRVEKMLPDSATGLPSYLVAASVDRYEFVRSRSKSAIA